MVTADGSLVLRMYYAADENTVFTVERWVHNTGDPNRPETDQVVMLDSTPYGGTYNNMGWTTDAWITLKPVSSATDAVGAGEFPVLIPRGYKPYSNPNEVLTGWVAGDGSLVLKIFFEGDPEKSFYTIERYLVDGEHIATLIPGDPITVDNITAGTYVYCDPASYDPAANGHPGYKYAGTAKVLEGGVLVDVFSNPAELYVSGDGTTVLKLYYVASDRVLVLDLGDGTWVDPDTGRTAPPDGDRWQDHAADRRGSSPRRL